MADWVSSAAAACPPASLLFKHPLTTAPHPTPHPVLQRQAGVQVGFHKRPSLDEVRRSLDGGARPMASYLTPAPGH